MIFSVDGRNNSAMIDNGTEMGENPIKVSAETVCTGAWTDFIIEFPGDADLARGKRRLANMGEPITVRVYHRD